MPWIAFCAASAAFATIAGVLMRKAALAGPVLPERWLPPQVTAPMVFLALAVLAYGGSFVGYFFAVRVASLRVAYPVMVGFTCVGLYSASVVYFGEPHRLVDAAGISLVVAGIAILARAA
jgi:multidrug transporter EmrE-like cation transporter